MKIKELLTDESKWCQGVLTVRNKDGLAIKWCLLGALIECYEGNTQHALMHSKIKAYINKITELNIPSWNDHAEFKDIKKLVQKLDI